MGEAEDRPVELLGDGAEVAREAGAVERYLAGVAVQLPASESLRFLRRVTWRRWPALSSKDSSQGDRAVVVLEGVGVRVVDAEQQAVEGAQEGGLAGLVGAVEDDETRPSGQVDVERFEVAEALDGQALKTHGAENGTMRGGVGSPIRGWRLYI